MRWMYALLTVFAMFGLAACEGADDEENAINGEQSGEQDPDSNEAESEDSILLEFYGPQGTLIDSVYAYPNEDIMFPSTPTKEGYVFTHWDLEWDGIDFSEELLEVHPVFEKAEYLITLLGPNGEIDAFYLEHGASIELDEAPSIEGYVFEGYEDHPEKAVESLTIEAIYSPVETEITITFYDFEADLIEETTFEHAEDITPPEVDAIDEHTFKGWAQEGSQNPLDLDTLGHGTYALYAVYEPEDTVMVDIYFDADDGSDPEHIQRPYESYIDIEDFPEVTKEDYTFSHWVEGEWNTEVFGGFEVFQETPITFVANWDGLTDAWRFDVSDEGAELIEYLGEDTDVVIPSLIGGEPVGIIGESLLATPPFTDGILDTLVIGDNVHTIKDSAFKNNTALTSVTFKNPDAIEVIGERSFENVPAEDLIVPQYVTHLGERSFANTTIDSLAFKGSLEFIGKEAFRDTSISGELVFPDTLKTIEQGAFENLDITNLTLNEGLQYIGREAFLNNTAIETLVIPSSVDTLKREAFRGLSDLKSVTFEENSQVTELSLGLFQDAPHLSDVVFPENLITIRGSAFKNNNALTTLDLPSSANDFRDYAFSDMLALETFEVPLGVTRLEVGTFNNTPKLHQITLPDSLEDIAAYAFQDSGLQTIDIPSNVTIIRNAAFQRASNLQSIDLPDHLEQLSPSVFRGATSLQTITIPSTIDTIEYGMFREASSLETVHLHSNLTEIEAYAFKDTPSLDSVILPESLHTLRHSSFKNSGLNYIYIPSSTNTVYERVFSGASNVTIAYEGDPSDIEDWHWNFNPDDRPIDANADKPGE